MIGVTGANGFLGYHLVRHLRDRGEPVCALVRRSRPELDALGIPIRAFDEIDGVATIAHVAGTFATRGDFRETMTEAITPVATAAMESPRMASFMVCSFSNDIRRTRALALALRDRGRLRVVG